MIENILFINDNSARLKIRLDNASDKDLVNLHLVFQDNEKRILGEIAEVTGDVIDIQFLGEFVGDKFIPGTIKKPRLESTVRYINEEELAVIMSSNEDDAFIYGKSILYNNIPLHININDFFSNHMAIFGNTGSGKSYGVSKLLQSLIYDPRNIALNSTFLVFDVHGEYYSAFSKIKEKNPNYTYKEYTPDAGKANGQPLKIPLWLLGVNDIGLLLKADEYSQLAILEKALYVLAIIAAGDERAERYKDHIVAKAIQSIMFSSKDKTKARGDIFEILSICSTRNFNLDVKITGIGYVRSFKKCFDITREGLFAEDILITEYLEGFIDDELEKKMVLPLPKCDLNDLEEALSFVIISEGLLNNAKIHNDAMMLKMKLHSLIVQGYNKYFDCKEFCTIEKYLYNMLTDENGRKVQIIGVDMDDFDSNFASFVAKTLSKMVFNYVTRLKVRGSLPINILLEEAHRFIMNNENSIFGDDIFDKIAREGRKYGVILTLISQRPTELSEVILSQCSSFILFRVNHPKDLEYMKKAIPNINANIIDKQRSIQPGYFVGLGKAFTIPMIIKLEKPDPAPSSSNAHMFEVWTGKKQ